MDPALLRERELFKKRALAVPVVEKRKAKDKDHDKPKPPKKQKVVEKAPRGEFDYRKASGSSQYKFGVLAKIVKHMKSKHQDGDTYPLTLDEILDETNQMDIGARMKHWLATEALNNNPKIDIIKDDGPEGDKYKFKPKYGFKDKKSFLRFLDKQDQAGMGGILQEDVEEALPRCAKVLKQLGDQIVYVDRPIDKKRVLFYNDKSHQFSVEEELQKLWRSCTVEGVDERKIEEYLDKHGITSMQDVDKKMPVQKRKKGGKKRNRQFKSHNDHLAGVLEDYSEKQK